MKRYTIMSMSRIVSGTSYTYNLVQTSGNYVCTRLPDTKIITDFIGLPNSSINSIKDEESPNRVIWTVGQETAGGRIKEIRLNNQRGEVLLGNARTVFTPLSALRSIATVTAATPVARTAAATTNVTPSRSNTPVAPVDQFTDLQVKLLQNRDIRLEKTLKKSLPTNLKDFLLAFFRTYNAEKTTIYVDDKSVQTTVGRRRSLGDIFKICRYYFPTCTLKEVLTLLYVTLPKTLTDGFRSSYCGTINKRVWYYAPGNTNTIANTDHKDEFGNIASWYTTKL